MRSIKKSGITALTAALALGMGVVVPAGLVTGGGAATRIVPAQAPAVMPAPAPPAPNYGWIALTTGAVDDVTIDANGNGVPEGEPQGLIEASGCKLATTGPSYLTFDGFVGSTGGKASFASNSLGVAEKKTGTSCYQVSAGSPSTAERLVLDLGARVASSAYLDVELKQGARILASAKVGSTTMGYYELQSGGSIGAPKWTDGVDTTKPYTVFTCNNPSDSGPDSGVNDNCRWPISAPSWRGAEPGETILSAAVNFDSLELKSLAGTFSLEGGADGAVPSAPPAPRPQGASLFELAGLECGAITETVSSSGEQPEITVRRLNNADPAETCVGIPYSLTHGLQSATFVKPSTQTSAQFVMDMVWQQAATDLGIRNTVVNFRNDPALGGDVTLRWCPDALYASDGTLTGLVLPLGEIGSGYAALPDQDEQVPNTQFACVASQSAQVIAVAGRGAGNPVPSNDTVQVVEQIYVLGDILLRKP